MYSRQQKKLSLYYDRRRNGPFCTFIVVLNAYLMFVINYWWNVGVVNELTAQEFTARFSQKNSELNELDIPEA